MSNGNLSPRQFSAPSYTVTPVTSHHQHGHIHMTDAGDRPLSLGKSTLGSVASASAWRTPNRVLPYSKATAGSTFKPYD